jgi:hypothetical protein
VKELSQLGFPVINERKTGQMAIFMEIHMKNKNK